MSGTPYLAVRPDREAPLRLFCFHHAGGGASVFSTWQDALGPSVAVQPVQLPGRERRVRDPRITDMAGLTRELERELDPYLDQPYACYGHSLGALVAFRLVMARRAAGRRLPEALLTGAANPPHLPPISVDTRGKSRDELVQWLRGMGGISPMILKYPEWVDAAVSLLRDDLALCDSHDHTEYRDSPPNPLPLPVHCFAGSDDDRVGAGVVDGWRRYGDASSSLFTVPGGHLFFRDAPEEFIGPLKSVLTQLETISQERSL
jgi:surfactin synthase thioesterase subunit